VTRYEPKSLLDRFVGGCIALLVAALALNLAARLIESIWTALLLMGISIALGAGLVAVLHWRRQSW
jgi:hypothetical protein